jgi:hypothetical protein
MSAPIVDLAQAVTDKLNTPGAFTPALNAERTYQLFYELAEAAAPKIAVYGTSDQSTEKCDRERWRHELTIDIAVQQKLADDASAARDAVVLLADSICEYIKANRPARPEKLMSATVNPLVQNDLLKQNKLFTSVVRLTFWSNR